MAFVKLQTFGRGRTDSVCPAKPGYCPSSIALDVQDRTKDRSKDAHRAAIVETVLVPAVIAVLVSTLEALLKVILVLAAVDVRLPTVRARSVNGIVAPARTSAAVTVGPSRSVALLIARVNRLPQKVRAAIVSVVPAAIAIHAIPRGVIHHRIRMNVVESAADLSRRVDLAAIGPIRLTLLLATSTVLLAAISLLVLLLNNRLLVLNVLLLVVIAVTLCVSCHART